MKAFFERQMESLSPRDKGLLVGLMLFGCLMFVFAQWWVLSGVLEGKAATVRDTKTRLAEMRQLEADYKVAATKLKAAEGKLAVVKTKPLKALVEELTTKHDINEKLHAVNKGSTETVGNIAQTRYTVEIKKSDQEPLYWFLYDLETYDYPVSVDQAVFKSSMEKREEKQDLTLELIVFSMVEGA